jgi:predicted ester cyclase
MSQLREFAERYTEAWCSQNAARVASCYSENGSLTVNSGPAAIGRTAIAKVAHDFMSTFPDMRVLMDELVSDGEQTVYRWTLVGTNTGPGGAGRRVRISGQEFWKMGSEGLIAESRGRFDQAEYDRQLKEGTS